MHSLQLIRREVVLGAASAMALPAAARARISASPVLYLWPDYPPGWTGIWPAETRTLRRPDSLADDVIVSHVARPNLTVVSAAKPNGASILIIPGGGYTRVAFGHEGTRIAQVLAASGYTCFVLLYRMPGDGWVSGSKAPLQDAQRALRLVAKYCTEQSLDTARIGVLGFSAGGHLAGWLSSTGDPTYPPVDRADLTIPRISALGLLYPVVLLEGPFVHAGSRQALATGRAAAVADLSLDRLMTGTSPPVFLAHALDDKSVPPENAIALIQALRRASRPSDCHLFESGGHGFGLARDIPASSTWMNLFIQFLKRHGT